MSRLERKRRVAARAIRAMATVEALAQSAGCELSRRIVLDEVRRLLATIRLGPVLGAIGAMTSAESLLFLPDQNLEEIVGAVEYLLSTPPLADGEQHD